MHVVVTSSAWHHQKGAPRGPCESQPTVEEGHKTGADLVARGLAVNPITCFLHREWHETQFSLHIGLVKLPLSNVQALRGLGHMDRYLVFGCEYRESQFLSQLSARGPHEQVTQINQAI